MHGASGFRPRGTLLGVLSKRLPVTAQVAFLHLGWSAVAAWSCRHADAFLVRILMGHEYYV